MITCCCVDLHLIGGLVPLLGFLKNFHANIRAKAADVISGQRKKRTNSGANKLFKKVKERAKKIKNSPTKLGHGYYNDHDVYEEECGKKESEWHVYTHCSVTVQPESLCHPGEANFQVLLKISTKEQKDFPLVTSDYTKRQEPSHYEILFMDTRG
ncbi:unnamed protein product [Eruca vesicaria subsp. sativa]|uniref:LTI65/LTI78 N-terminal domain-containing protein n=1 Tax=Eruca vesicaria subsp. sativa TaxID=29727 RepID=A0ABC8L0Q3_ERUVS|nr:unnamed protein product [Eruca vesicaria subsp. sativa]